MGSSRPVRGAEVGAAPDAIGNQMVERPGDLEVRLRLVRGVWVSRELWSAKDTVNLKFRVIHNKGQRE